jgi:hypothetical protein
MILRLSSCEPSVNEKTGECNTFDAEAIQLEVNRDYTGLSRLALFNGRPGQALSEHCYCYTHHSRGRRVVT